MHQWLVIQGRRQGDVWELAQQPVVDNQRVDAVRQAISDGSFEVNPTRIADQLLSLERAIF